MFIVNAPKTLDIYKYGLTFTPRFHNNPQQPRMHYLNRIIIIQVQNSG